MVGVEPYIGLMTAGLGLFAAVIVMLTKLRKDVSSVHVLVNSKMTETLNRVIQLEEALTAAHIAIPAKEVGQKGNNDDAAD